MLLGNNANVDLPDPKSGRTPLLVAAHHGHQNVVRLLLEGEAWVHFRDDQVNTALWIAVAEGHDDVVELLLEAGAHANSMNGVDKCTPLGTASSKGNERLVELLLKGG